MQQTQIVKLVQSVISSIQNTGLFVVRSIIRLSNKTLSVKVTNPQDKIKVEGKVEVDQSATHGKIGGIILAINGLKKALKPKDKVEVTNMVKIPPYPKFPELPKFPEFPKGFDVNNFKELVPSLQKMANMIREIDVRPHVKVEAPVVNVPAPIVNVPKQPTPDVHVEAPDMSELSKIMTFLEGIGVKKPLAVRLSDGAKFYKALEKMADIYAGSSSMPSFQDTSGNPGMATLNRNHEVQVTVSDTWIANDTDTVGDTTYVGEETVDGRWRVRKIVKVVDVNTITYATSKNNPSISSYNDAWTARATLDYQRVSLAL